ncbi:ABC transporter ATP-binding protein [Caldinitratiruptor microaerophilus]|uniref:ABC transporter ATP-binding protein n=1 Tax=Caldinitratiruptor microaerophilus TaxID=671077 RepID=A0AA35CIY9_9FIRM|nr:ABC transporter ATP-binding protein [Caldinitratiruptor microaerophilus]BDG60119.1 ABC transporter ATP-binding protein [Caldinitratiruptor microaerophilus]
MGVILEVQGLTKRYGGLEANKDLTFSVAERQVYGIAGPNGAGKTTLFDMISGHTPPTSGTIRFRGEEIQQLQPEEVCHRGIARTFQTPVVFGTQSVLANALVGSAFGRQGGSVKGGSVAPTLRFRPEEIDEALAALEFVGLLDKQAQLAETLSVFDKKRLMIASALATRPKLLMLDEPVGGLNRAEREQLVELVRKVNAAGVTVLIIEHVMKALLALADRLLIIHHGEKLAEGNPSDVIRDERVVAVYLGEQARDLVAALKGG